MQSLQVGKIYKRVEVMDSVGVPPTISRKGGSWFTGYARHGNVICIFCNVGVAGRTGHDYSNTWVGKTLR